MNLVNGMGFGSTEFHVIRVKNINELNPKYVWFLLRLRHLREAAQRFFTGSAGQQRVTKEFLEDLCIPIPPPEIQDFIVMTMEEELAKTTASRNLAEQRIELIRQEVDEIILGTHPLNR